MKLFLTQLVLVIVLTIMISTLVANAQEVMIYAGDSDYPINQNKLVLDDEDMGGDVDLQFGRTIGAYLRHTGTTFQFSDDVDLGGNQLLNFRIENLNIIPTCNSSASGRLYYNTADGNSYVCNGTLWMQIDKEVTQENLAAVQARNTAAFAIPTSYGDITLNATDVETNSTAVYHNTINTDRIEIAASGLYLITYHSSLDLPGFSTARTVDARVRLNDSTVLAGSEGTSATMNNAGTNDDVYNQLNSSFLAELTAGDFITLQMQTSGTLDTFANTTLTATKMDGVVVEKATGYVTALFDAYDSTGNTSVTTTQTVLNMDTTRIADSDYTLAADEVTFNTAGVYRLTGRLSVLSDDTTGITRSNIIAQFQENTTGSFLDVPGASCNDYIREDAGANTSASCTVTWIGTFDVGDAVRMTHQMSGSTTGLTIPEGSALTIELIRTI